VGGVAFAPIDYVMLAILGLALLRGLVRGLLRESFSIASLGTAVVGVRLWCDPVAAWLTHVSKGGVGELAAPWLAGALIAVVAIGVTTLAGRLVRRGAKAAGLGWADRAGGAVLGTAEGLLIAGCLIGLIGHVGGRDNSVLAGSRSLEAFQQLERIAQTRDLPLPDVAARGPRRADAR
jgi:membrane protein required for colicin V production